MGLRILRKIDLLFNWCKILYEKAYIMKLVPENLSYEVGKTENQLTLARILAVSCMAPFAYIVPFLEFSPVPPVPHVPLDYFFQFLIFAVGYKTLTFTSHEKLKNMRLEVCIALDLENRLDELNMCKEDKDFILLVSSFTK